MLQPDQLSDTDLFQLVVAVRPQVVLGVTHLLRHKPIHISHQGGHLNLPPVAPSSTEHGHTIAP